MHFPEVPGLVGDDTEGCAWDPVSVSPDDDLKRKEDCYYRIVCCWPGV